MYEPEQKPIIIVGYPRSGTSLLRVILDSHPDLSIGPELKFIKKFIKKFPRDFNEFYALTSMTADDYGFNNDKLKEIFNNSKSWEQLMVNWCSEFAARSGKKYWGEKTPQNFKFLPKLLKTFPKAFYIYIVRNPFDVMGSMKIKGWYNQYKSVISWTFANFRARKLSAYNSIFLTYEEFVHNPDKYLEEIQLKAGLKKCDILSRYMELSHGKIAKGDIWNQEIKSSEKTRKRNELTMKDKFYIYFFCFPYLIKHRYK